MSESNYYLELTRKLEGAYAGSRVRVVGAHQFHAEPDEAPAYVARWLLETWAPGGLQADEATLFERIGLGNNYEPIATYPVPPAIDVKCSTGGSYAVGKCGILLAWIRRTKIQLQAHHAEWDK